MSQKTNGIQGVITPLITPASIRDSIKNSENGNQDLEKQINHIIGVTNGILVSGETGESRYLTREERRYNLEWAVRYAEGRAPVLGNVTDSNAEGNLDEILERTKENIGDAVDAKADAVIVCPHYYSSINHDNVVKFMTKIAKYSKYSKLPVYIYINIAIHHNKEPMNLKNIEKLSKHKNIAGAKVSSDEIDYFMQILAMQNDNFAVFQGSERLIYDSFKGDKKPAGIVPSIANLYPAAISSVYQHISPQGQDRLNKLCKSVYGDDYEGIISGLKSNLVLNRIISTPDLIRQ